MTSWRWRVMGGGSGCWINVGALRQARPGLEEEDFVLFDPVTAYRSANGVVISWWLKSKPKEATLEILDSSGQVVRTFTPAVEGEERDRWAGPALPMEAGLNRLRWDLRTDPATTFPGMILWGVRTMAPTVPPGRYTVRLSGEGMEETTEVVVERNPWITDVTDEDLVAQYEFGVRIRDQVDRANRAVIEIRRVKGELEERLAASDDEGLREAGERLRAALDELEGEIYQVRNRSNQDPLNFPIKVTNRLANLLSMVERGDGRPGRGMYEVFEVMVGRLGGVLGKLEEVWEGKLGDVNDELERSGREEILLGGVGVSASVGDVGGWGLARFQRGRWERGWSSVVWESVLRWTAATGVPSTIMAPWLARHRLPQNVDSSD